MRGEIAVFKGGEQVALLHPEKRRYWVQQSVMTEAGIDMKLTRDIFAALGEDLGSGRWSVRAQVRPMINYMWIAALLMAFGGLLAAADRRYRQPAAARAGAEALAGSGGAVPGRAG